MTALLTLTGTLFGSFIGYCIAVIGSALMIMETGHNVYGSQALESAMAIGPMGAATGALLSFAITLHRLILTDEPDVWYAN